MDMLAESEAQTEKKAVVIEDNGDGTYTVMMEADDEAEDQTEAGGEQTDTAGGAEGGAGQQAGNIDQALAIAKQLLTGGQEQTRQDIANEVFKPDAAQAPGELNRIGRR